MESAAAQTDTPQVDADPSGIRRKEHPEPPNPDLHREWIIKVYVNVLRIWNIDTVKNTFEAVFYMRLTWVEKGACDKEADSLFDPKLFFLNATECPTEFNKRIQVSTFREGPNGEDVVEFAADYQGVFNDFFHLKGFPFDAQMLTIMIRTNHIRQGYKYPMAG